ncbi:extensin [Paracoccus zhejiangensis]|uniref:Extensin n=2 Tax=Paracoccus zhejiangensis TaxID=1077935 RepID=A0A2H5F4G8_9RHOB|nr:extensin [Paracoccus zhejiangensis]
MAAAQAVPDPAGAERPPEKPVQAEAAQPAPAPPEKPAEAAEEAADDAVDATLPVARPDSTPAEPPADGPEAEAGAEPEPEASTTPPDDPKPVGRLIPPEETAAPEPPAEPKGPPVRETLRESDFDYAACLLALHDLGSVYEEIATISQPDQRDCGIARPIRVTEILPGIALQGGAAMRCDTARSLGFWMRDFVRPAVARLPDAPRLSGVQLGTTYDCRGRVGGEAEAEAKLSEHAFGNAIDISAFTFHDGPPLPVEPRQDSGDLVESFQRAVRGAACLEFTTVLGPGSNASHNDHLHLDIAARNGGWRLCQ